MAGLYPPEFFLRPTLEVAPELLGAKLTTWSRARLTSGIIVEVEAYIGEVDPATHCFHRRTPRNDVMFWEGGHCYVYFIYGMYHCVNVVTEPAGKGAAVLIRAVEPLDGIDLMRRRRKVGRDIDLTSGPGKLCRALRITERLWGEHFLHSEKIAIAPLRTVKSSEIATSGRIGISEARDLQWRFFLKGSPWVSRARPAK